MPLHFALLTSLLLHALLAAPALWRRAPHPPPPQRLDVRLVMPEPDAATPAAEAVSTAPPPPPALPVNAPPTPQTPNRMAGPALRRAQGALSRHLYYPPEAVAQGLEGEVVLLLTLGDGGRVLVVEVARSSGHAILDQAALDAARRIGNLPGNAHQTLLPVSFRLQ